MGSNELTAWLNEQVEERGWSFRELSRRAVVSSGTISKVTTGAILPTWDFCFKVATALDYPPMDVFVLAGLLPDAPDDNEMLAEAQYLFSRLPDDEQERFLAQMRAILELRRDRKKTR